MNKGIKDIQKMQKIVTCLQALRERLADHGLVDQMEKLSTADDSAPEKMPDLEPATYQDMCTAQHPLDMLDVEETINWKDEINSVIDDVFNEQAVQENDMGLVTPGEKRYEILRCNILMVAIHTGNVTVARMLLDNNVSDVRGTPPYVVPLSVACMCKDDGLRREFVQLLLDKGANVDDCFCNTDHHYVGEPPSTSATGSESGNKVAAASSDTQTTPTLEDEYRMSVLQYTAACLRIDTMATLLEHHASTEAPPDSIIYSPLCLVCVQGCIEGQQKLIAAGADVNALSGAEMTSALMMAINHGRIDETLPVIVKNLLDAGATVNTIITSAPDALPHNGVTTHKVDMPLIALLRMVALVNRNLTGPLVALQPPLQDEEKRMLDILQAVAMLLLEHGADPNAVESGSSIKVCHGRVEQEITNDAAQRYSALQLALMTGLDAFVHLLINAGANPDQQSCFVTFGIATERSNTKFLDLLFDHGLCNSLTTADERRQIAVAAVDQEFYWITMQFDEQFADKYKLGSTLRILLARGFNVCYNVKMAQGIMQIARIVPFTDDLGAVTMFVNSVRNTVHTMRSIKQRGDASSDISTMTSDLPPAIAVAAAMPKEIESK